MFDQAEPADPVWLGLLDAAIAPMVVLRARVGRDWTGPAEADAAMSDAAVADETMSAGALAYDAINEAALADLGGGVEVGCTLAENPPGRLTGAELAELSGAVAEVARTGKPLRRSDARWGVQVRAGLVEGRIVLSWWPLAQPEAGHSPVAADRTADDGVSAAGKRGVDELRAARQQAQQRSDLLQATLDSLLDPHVLLRAVTNDAGDIVDFVYADANDAACQYMQMERADLVGASLLTLLPGQAASGMLDLYVRAVTSGEPLILDDYTYPHEILGSQRRYDIRAIRVGDALSFTWRDVTDRYRAAQALLESESRYRLLAENASDVVFRADPQCRFQWVSPSSAEMLGWTAEDLVGRELASLVHPEDLPAAQESMARLASGEKTNFEARVCGPHGRYTWLGASARPVCDPDGIPVGCVGTFRDIEETRAAREALSFRATHDALTELVNRAELLSRLGHLLGPDRWDGSGLALLFADMDDLKRINDTYGHHVGDEAIIAVARRIVSAVRASDIVGRIGGDEFVIALKAVGTIAEAWAVADKIHESMRQPLHVDGISLRLSVSVGIALAGADDSPEQALRRADEALYQAKAGRNAGTSVAIGTGD